jgi:hypothetical protein
MEILQSAPYPFLYFKVIRRHYGMNCGRYKMKGKKIKKYSFGMTIAVRSTGTRN